MRCEGEDALRYPALEVSLIEVEFRFILVLLWNLQEVKLVVDALHFLLPVLVVMVAFCPKEILVQKLWYNILRG